MISMEFMWWPFLWHWSLRLEFYCGSAGALWKPVWKSVWKPLRCVFGAVTRVVGSCVCVVHWGPSHSPIWWAKALQSSDGYDKSLLTASPEIFIRVNVAKSGLASSSLCRETSYYFIFTPSSLRLYFVATATFTVCRRDMSFLISCISICHHTQHSSTLVLWTFYQTNYL